MNYANVPASIAKIFIYLAGIQNGRQTDANGNYPSIADRIAAGACLITLFVLIDEGGEIDEQELRAYIRDELGEHWAAA